MALINILRRTISPVVLPSTRIILASTMDAEGPYQRQASWILYGEYSRKDQNPHISLAESRSILPDNARQ